jgi:ubiquinone/menaquinone biosynthesis C-methylase UbiE
MCVSCVLGACRHERWYDRHVTPLMIHGACLAPPITAQRRKIVPLAQGDVLELGMGTGLNLPHYDPAKVTRLVGIDPGLGLMRHAERTARTMPFDVALHVDSAEAMPFEDASFDTVVVTYSFCTIPDGRAAMREVRRVLKPAGRLLFSEHGLSDRPATRWWQRRLEPLWKRVAGGCHLTRDIERLLLDEGFAVQHLEKGRMPGVPGLLGFNYLGSATVR